MTQTPTISVTRRPHVALRPTTISRLAVHLVPLLLLFGLAGTAKAETINAWTNVDGTTTASGTGKEIALSNVYFAHVDCKLTAFAGKIHIFQGDITGRLHWVYTIDTTGGAVTCPTSAGTSDPCAVNLNPGYGLVRIDFSNATAGMMDSCDVTGRK